MVAIRRRARWVFTCEHGGCEVPPAYAALFRGGKGALESHRGWDAGALEVFAKLAPACGDAAFPATTTRLLIDLNRSLHHPRVFSEFTRPLPPDERAQIAARWWQPWREAVAHRIGAWLVDGYPVLHLSVHSFVPVLDGVRRNADIGLLYDPARGAEQAFCRRWRELLAARGWRVRMNYPYRGRADGHTTALRRRFAEGYAGVELELNQALWPARHAQATADLAETLATLRSEGQPTPNHLE
jgi:predicted N-formylglutamate amidohydrolase